MASHDLNDRRTQTVGRAGTETSRRALLDAVGVILEREGLEGMSLRKVAAQAGLSHAAPGVLFGGRAAMLTAYAAEGFRQLGARMERAEQLATDARSALSKTGLAYVLFAVDEPLRFQVMFRSDRLLPRDPEYLQASRDAFTPLQQAIDRGLAEGVIAPADADDVMVTAWSVVHGLANLWFSKHLAGRIKPDPSALAARVTSLFAAAILRPTAPESTRDPRLNGAGSLPEQDSRSVAVPAPSVLAAPRDPLA